MSTGSEPGGEITSIPAELLPVDAGDMPLPPGPMTRDQLAAHLGYPLGDVVNDINFLRTIHPDLFSEEAGAVVCHPEAARFVIESHAERELLTGASAPFETPETRAA